MGPTALHFVSDWHDPILRGIGSIDVRSRGMSTSRVHEQGIAKCLDIFPDSKHGTTPPRHISRINSQGMNPIFERS